MASLFRDVDALLRGRFTRPGLPAAGRVDLPIPRLAAVALLLGAGYGLCMGLFGAMRGGTDGWMQLVACVTKVPLLFLLTLVVTFPSLYVSSALHDAPIEPAATLRLLLIAIAVDLALLASLGPVVAFFTVSTTSYPFMVLLNVLVFALAGLAGLAVIRRALDSLFSEGGEPAVAGRRPAPRTSSRFVFQAWLVIVAVVGAQLGWVLRPFVGSPGLPFTWFRARESNFFEACANAVGQLLR
jgi:hypothetical protein